MLVVGGHVTGHVENSILRLRAQSEVLEVVQGSKRIRLQEPSKKSQVGFI